MRHGTRPAAIAPFRTLDPALALAERLLAAGDPRLLPVLAALPDERAAATALNTVLTRAGASPRLRGRDDAWWVAHVDGRGAESELVSAATGIAALVAVAGWGRFKRCETCAAPFVDRTNGRTRRWCVAHRPGVRSARAQADARSRR